MKPTIDMHVRVCMCEHAHTLPGCWLLVEGFKGRIVGEALHISRTSG